MDIPWKVKSAAFSVVDVVGDVPLYFAQKYITKRASPRGLTISPNWRFHQQVIRESGAKRILEFGAGKDLVQNLFLAQENIEQVAVDLFDMLDIGLVNKAIVNLDAAGVPTKGAVSDRADLQSKYRIEFIAPLDMCSSRFHGGSFDLCISTNTLEHIPRDVIQKIWRECSRILKSNGLVSAKIDYSDHYWHTDKSIGELNYLKFSEKEWTRYNHRNHYQNRLRHKHHLDLLREAGFAVVSDRVEDTVKVDHEVNAENLTGHATDYSLTGFIVARNAGGVQSSAVPAG